MANVTTTRHDAKHNPQPAWVSAYPGWAVEYVNGEVTVRKYFADDLYGSSAKAKSQAEKFADSLKRCAPFVCKAFTNGLAT